MLQDVREYIQGCLVTCSVFLRSKLTRFPWLTSYSPGNTRVCPPPYYTGHVSRSYYVRIFCDDIIFSFLNYVFIISKPSTSLWVWKYLVSNDYTVSTNRLSHPGGALVATRPFPWRRKEESYTWVRVFPLVHPHLLEVYNHRKPGPVVCVSCKSSSKIL